MAASPASLTVVVPLHDEAPGVTALATAMRRFVEETARDRAVDLVLVDDGSTDGTDELLREDFEGLPHQVVRHDDNRGLTAALCTGLRSARGELIAWLDSDLTYHPDILEVLARAVDDGADVAIASCYHPDGQVEGVAGFRRFLSSLASRAYQRLTGTPIHTFTCMVRVYRRPVLDACAPRHQGFLGVTEVLLAAIQRGYKLVEVPSTLNRRRRGQSKMRVMSVGVGHLGLFMKLLLRRPAGA